MGLWRNYRGHRFPERTVDYRELRREVLNTQREVRHVHPRISDDTLADRRQDAFRSNRDGNYEIYVMNADGSDQTDITNNTSADLDPAWGKVPARRRDRWGEETADPPDFFYASDIPTDVKTLHEEAITTAAQEWGNFGPWGILAP